MNERVRTFWHKIDGLLGGVLIALAFGLFGYVIRGYEDGGIVATLLERVKAARTDERAQSAEVLRQMAQSYQDRAKLRDEQVRVLILQNQALFGLVSRDSASKNVKLTAIDAQVKKATAAADSADQKAAINIQKTDQLQQQLNTATQPTAVVPSHSWAGKRKP